MDSDDVLVWVVIVLATGYVIVAILKILLICD